jgi:ferrochelatase
MSTGRHAIVLMNLGGPDRPEAVEPFLFNLFNDPAIIRLPGLIRPLVARLITLRRTKTARAIYDRIGGGSPILPETEAQARALESALDEPETKVFIAMRYWHPRAYECAVAVKDFNPDTVTLLPLYPQFSTTTTASSLKDWHEAARMVGLKAPTSALCCYPTLPGLVSAQAALIRDAFAKVPAGMRARLLLSAHGLPRKIVALGDPYPVQVAWTAEALVRELDMRELDWAVCYQSRVGPLEWIGPPVERELEQAAREKVAVVINPIAFVSEHSETLVELDMEYRHRAETLGVPAYVRVPTVSTHPEFIKGLADLVRSGRGGAGIQSQSGGRLCPRECGGCALTPPKRRSTMFDPDPITAAS